jgi:hypothetical protein
MKDSNRKKINKFFLVKEINENKPENVYTFVGFVFNCIKISKMQGNFNSDSYKIVCVKNFFRTRKLFLKIKKN